MTRSQTLTRTCRTEGCTAPADADHATLHRTTDKGLLTAFAALTHQMDALTRRLDGGDLTAAERRPMRDQQAALRGRRDMVEAECLRRMGGQ